MSDDAIKTQCPYCLAKFRVQAQFVGKSAKCRACHADFVMFSISTMAETEPESYTAGFAALREALEDRLGPTDGRVQAAMPPFYLGGGADVLAFPAYPDGVAYVTCGPSFDKRQKQSSRGGYELMMCSSEPAEFMGGAISQLAKQTLSAVMEPGHTIDLGPNQPAGSTMRGLLCLLPDIPKDPIRLFGRRIYVLMLFGVTLPELRVAMDERKRPGLIDKLRSAGALPLTDIRRRSVV